MDEWVYTLLLGIIFSAIVVVLAYYCFNSIIFSRIFRRKDSSAFLKKRLVPGYDSSQFFPMMSFLLPVASVLALILVAILLAFYIHSLSMDFLLPVFLLFPIGIILAIRAPLDEVSGILPDLLLPNGTIMWGMVFSRNPRMTRRFSFHFASIFWTSNGGLAAGFGQWMRRVYTLILFPINIISIVGILDILMGRKVEDKALAKKLGIQF